MPIIDKDIKSSTLVNITPRGRFLDCIVEQIRHSPNIFARICGEKVGHRRTAKMDRAISMDVAERKTYEKSTPAVDFIKVGRTAQI